MLNDRFIAGQNNIKKLLHFNLQKLTVTALARTHPRQNLAPVPLQNGMQKFSADKSYKTSKIRSYKI